MKPFSPKHTSIAPPPSGSAPPFARHHAQCSTARSRSCRVRGLWQRPCAGRREGPPSPHRDVQRDTCARSEHREVSGAWGRRRAHGGVSVMTGTAEAGEAVLGRSVRLSEMAGHTCAEPPGAHPREGAARGGAARPVAAWLVGVVGRPAGALLRGYRPWGAADGPRRVVGP